MTVVVILLIVAVVGAVVWVTLRQADALLARREPSALFEVDEAIEFVASALPGEVSARLSYEDVEALLGWHLVHLAGRPQGIDIADDEAVADLVRWARADDREISEGDVRAVLAAEAAYLVAVGAVHPDEPEGPPPG